MDTKTDHAPELPLTEAIENPTLLIVDDSRLMRYTLKKILADDFNLVEAVDGEDGWEKLLAEPRIQGVFSDLSMPNLDGYGLLARIRNAEEARISNLPFIVITGKEGDDQSLLEEVRAHGGNDVISKPFQSADIIGKTKTFLAAESQVSVDSGQATAEQAHAVAEEVARQAAEEAEAKRRAEEAEAQRRAEEVARQAAEEAEAKRRAEEAEAQRRAEEAARQAAEEAEAKRRAEAEAEAERFTPLAGFCVRIALPFMSLANNALGLQMDDQLAALRKRLGITKSE